MEHTGYPPQPETMISTTCVTEYLCDTKSTIIKDKSSMLSTYYLGSIMDSTNPQVHPYLNHNYHYLIHQCYLLPARVDNGLY